MIEILSSDSYHGFAAELATGVPSNRVPDQIAFIGRVKWDAGSPVQAAVVKVYRHETCGVANELIGYVMNHYRGVAQPRKAAVMLLRPDQLPPMFADSTPFVNPDAAVAVCWLTSFEANARPFSTVRRPSSFSTRESTAFYCSEFCRALASVDTVTGNNDRHDGNFLYVDDLHYLAIDQGCVGGGPRWHLAWPDFNPSNEIVRAIEGELTDARRNQWYSHAILEHEQSAPQFLEGIEALKQLLPGLIGDDEIVVISEYMQKRVPAEVFSKICQRLC